MSEEPTQDTIKDEQDPMAIDPELEAGEIISSHASLIELSDEEMDKLEPAQLKSRLKMMNILHKRMAETSREDPLTGYLNERGAVDRVTELLADQARDRKDGINNTVLVGFVDLRGMKAVNDAYNHEVGDKYIKRLGENMREQIRPTDKIARLKGGDEFLVIATGVGLEDDAAEGLMGRLKQSTQAELDLVPGDPPLHPDAHVGFVLVDASRFAQNSARSLDEWREVAQTIISEADEKANDARDEGGDRLTIEQLRTPMSERTADPEK